MLRRLAFMFLAALLSTQADALLFRAYVASDGNDANPCTLVSPCRLLPAALAAVANGGEIWMLDSANYNTATVNVGKSVTILAVPGAVGSVVAIAGPAIAVTAPSLYVNLRNLVIVPFPGGGGTHGVAITGASFVTIDRSLIASHVNDAIRVIGTGRLKVTDSILNNNGGTAIRLEEGATADVVSTRMLGNLDGVTALSSTTASTTASVSDSAISETNYAVSAQTNVAGAVARVFLTRSTIHSAAYALTAVTSGEGTATVAVSNSMIVNSGFAWYQDGVGSTIRSFQNNAISDNDDSLGSLTNTPPL